MIEAPKIKYCFLLTRYLRLILFKMLSDILPLNIIGFISFSFKVVHAPQNLKKVKTAKSYFRYFGKLQNLPVSSFQMEQIIF